MLFAVVQVVVVAVVQNDSSAGTGTAVFHSLQLVP
jgi:hypothetical protein